MSSQDAFPASEAQLLSLAHTRTHYGSRIGDTLYVAGEIEEAFHSSVNQENRDRSTKRSLPVIVEVYCNKQNVLFSSVMAAFL